MWISWAWNGPRILRKTYPQCPNSLISVRNKGSGVEKLIQPIENSVINFKYGSFPHA